MQSHNVSICLSVKEGSLNRWQNTAISDQEQFNKIVIISIRRHNDENFLNSDDFPRVDLFIYAQSPE